MFRILIVEDDEATSARLHRRISKALPEAQICIAETVVEGHRSIEQAYYQRVPYHAVVLDLKLPEDKGENTALDESICFSIRELMPATLIAHISAYMDDPSVQDHVKNVHDQQIDRSFRLSKLDTGYTSQLVSKLKIFLYGLRIEEQLNKLFGSSDIPSFAPRGSNQRARGNYESSVTHELAGLSRDIATYWNDLDEALQARIRRTFEVNAVGDKIIVSLF